MPHMNACIGFLPLHRALAVLTIAAGLLAAATLAFDIPAKAILILFCLLLGVYLITVYSQVLRLMQNCEKSKTEKQYTSDILYKQAELDALQSQINPHFLYNTLDSIRGQAWLRERRISQIWRRHCRRSSATPSATATMW